MGSGMSASPIRGGVLPGWWATRGGGRHARRRGGYSAQRPDGAVFAAAPGREALHQLGQSIPAWPVGWGTAQAKDAPGSRGVIPWQNAGSEDNDSGAAGTAPTANDSSEDHDSAGDMTPGVS